MSFYDYEVYAQDGSKGSLDAYREQDFEILDFPCNQFKAQAPESDEEINQFCTLTYNSDFPRFKPSARLQTSPLPDTDTEDVLLITFYNCC